MPIAALIFAPQTDVDTVPAPQIRVVGQSVLEYQVRTAHRAGAQHILIFAERISPDILAASDRLARDNIKVEIVRTVEEAGDHLHPDELTIITAANVVAEPAVYRGLAQNENVGILALRDAAGLETLERIDGFTRWSGLALVSGSLVRQTARTVGDWDFAGTLLRQALQSGVGLEILDQRHSDAPLIAIVQDQDTAALVNKSLLHDDQDVPFAGLIDYYLWTPLSSFLMLILLRGSAEPNIWVALVALLNLLTLVSVWLAPMIVPMTLFVVAALVARIAQRLVHISLRNAKLLDIVNAGRAIVGGISLVIMARRLVDYGIGWGYYILAVWLLVEMFRLAVVDPWFVGKHGLPVWRATPDAVALGLIVGHLTDFDVLSLELMIAYAIASSGILKMPRRS